MKGLCNWKCKFCVFEVILDVLEVVCKCIMLIRLFNLLFKFIVLVSVRYRFLGVVNVKFLVIDGIIMVILLFIVKLSFLVIVLFNNMFCGCVIKCC